MQNMPVIDIAPAAASASRRKEAARAIDDACRDIGFSSIVGHGLPDALIQESLAVAPKTGGLEAEDL